MVVPNLVWINKNKYADTIRWMMKKQDFFFKIGKMIKAFAQMCVALSISSAFIITRIINQFLSVSIIFICVPFFQLFTKPCPAIKIKQITQVVTFKKTHITIW
jgi:hypothetical protein